MKAWINGIGWVTPAGYGQGRQVQSQPLVPGELKIPTRKDVFTKIDRRFGRLDDFSRIGLAAVTFCLRDGSAEEWQEKRPLGIVAASRYGCLQTDMDYLQTMIPQHGLLASPNLFAYTLPNCFLGEAALRFGLTGNSMIINRHEPGYLASLKFGLEELAWSEQRGVLAGIVDLSPAPTHAASDDLPGSLFLLLERTPRAEARSYGELELQGEELRFNGEVFGDLSKLVATCLKVHRS
jgi:3-oxoacyl-[acyl-carrier-protein] synthase II